MLRLKDLKTVAIIGDREITELEAETLTCITRHMVRLGLNIRSCGSTGAGTVVANAAAGGKLTQYLPFATFNGLAVNGKDLVGLDSYGLEASKKAFSLATNYHGTLAASVQYKGMQHAINSQHHSSLFRLVARGVMMVTGGTQEEGPIDLLIVCADVASVFKCPKTGIEHCIDVVGNSGISVRVAVRSGTPILNLRCKDDVNTISAMLTASQ